MTDQKRKPRVYVRAANYPSFRNARLSVPSNVREHIELHYVEKPIQLRGLRHPMVWRFEGWEQHPQAQALDAAEEAAMSTRWSWPPAEVTQ